MPNSITRLDDLIEFRNLIAEEKGCYLVQPRPSEETIRATEEALGFTFPPSFLQYVRKSQYYSFETDLTHPHSLVSRNRWFYEESDDCYLPNFLILFTSGHDGDCDCFDSRSRDERGECPIVYWDAEEMTEDDIKDLQPTYPSFVEYLEFMVEHELNQL